MNQNISIIQQRLCHLQVAQLKGIIQVEDRKISSLQRAVDEAKAKSMARNVVISGITGDEEEEDCKEKVESFIKQKLRKEITENEVQVAHRLGPKVDPEKDRAMVVRCSEGLRRTIFKFTKNLKGQKNNKKQPYYVDPQLPASWAAERRALNNKLRRARNKNNKRKQEDQVPIQIKNNILHINNQPQKNLFAPPTVTEVLSVTRKEVERLDKIQVAESQMYTEKGSMFCAYASPVSTPAHVRDCYMKIKLWHPEADHVMMATVLNGDYHSCDNGEDNAGIKLERVLEQRETKEDVAVFVVREYGLVQLGPRRFHLIREVANEALNKLQELKQNL